MAKIILGNSDYARPFAGVPEILVRNAFYEEAPTNTIDQVAFIRRPAVTNLLTVGVGPIRKISYVRDLFNNDFFVISGPSVFRVHRTGPKTFTTTQITGTLDLANKPSMVASGTNLFITDQVNLYYTDGTAPLSMITSPGGPIYKLVYLGGYVIAIVKNSQRFYWLTPGATTIDGLAFAEAESAPDWITDALVLGDQLYLAGGKTVEVWVLTGDLTAPFQRIQGRIADTGVMKRTACVIPNTDTPFFLGADGTARVGPQLTKVSNPGIEERLRRAIVDDNIANL